MPPPVRRSGRDTRKVQTRLSFEPSSPALASSGAPPARIVYQNPRMPKKKELTSNASSRPHWSNDDDDDDDVFERGKPYAVVVHSSPSLNNASQKQGMSFMAAASSSVKKRTKPISYPVNSTDSDSSSEEDVRIATEKPKKRPSFLADDSESSLQSQPRATMKNKVVHTPNGSKADTPNSKKKYISTRSFIAGGYLAPVRTSSPRSANPRRNPADGISPISRKSKGKEIIALSSDEHSDSDGFVELKSPVQTLLPARRKIMTDDSNEEEKEAQTNRKRRRDSSPEDDDEPVRSSPTKRRKPVFHEDKPSEPKTKKPGSRCLTRQADAPKRHRTDKQKKLELIKRRRAGEKIDELTESSSEGEMERGAYDTNSEHEALSVFDDEDSAEGIEAVRRTLRPNVRNQDDDSFVVEDDDEPLGVPSYNMNDIPLEFTHNAHKPLKEHFKDAVEWMVKKKINPSFNQTDQVYIQAFRKLEPEARGLANSKFSSSAWSENFTRALWARPAFHEEDIGVGDEGEGGKCDACGRSNHVAKFRVQLRGKPYHHTTLEEVESENDESEDEGESSATESRNSKGQKILSEDTTFYLGRFCRANAERAHSLIHWKHALNEWVVQTLEEEGFLEPHKLAERIKWSQRKLDTFANKIVDEWTDNGDIKSLYRDFKNTLDVARNQKSDRWNA